MSNWMYGEEQKVRCPECQVVTTGLDWITQGNDTDGYKVTGMKFEPCGDTISALDWELKPSGARGALELTRIER